MTGKTTAKTLGLSAIAGALFAASLAFAGAANAGVITHNGGGANDIDTNPATVVSLNVPAPTAPDTGVITDINLSIRLAGTPFWDDMDIRLVHVNSATAVDVVINLGTGISGAFDVTLDDAAAGLLPGGGNAVGTFLADNPLSAFNGLNAQGQWRLEFFDGLVPNDGDDLVAWSLTITTTDNVVQAPEPMTAAIFGVALIGLAAMRRRQALRA